MTALQSGRSFVIVGAGGHGRVVAVLSQRTGHVVTGFLDRNAGRLVDQIRVLGGDDALDSMAPRTVDMAMGLGSRAAWGRRRTLCERIEQGQFGAPQLIDPEATVMPGVELGCGTQILMGARVQHGASIGAWCIVNTGSIVEHDCRIAAHVHIAPGAILCGGVTVGENAFVGAGSVIKEGLTIGAGATIAAGAVVVRDVGYGETVMGVPARGNNGH